jgi:hypothetical protein
MMEPLYDYFYRFPRGNLGVPGRCRVRIYKHQNGTHTVLLTELNSSSGESIAGASERIATDLVALRGLNPKTTRWIEHAPPDGDSPHEFTELQFTWADDNTAHDPQWERLDDAQAEALTGEGLSVLNRRLGDAGLQIEGQAEDVRAETEGTA